MGWFTPDKKQIVEQPKKVIESSKKESNDKLQVVVAYTMGELRSTGSIYRVIAHASNMSIKPKPGPKFFYHSKSLSGADSKDIKEWQNVIIESILLGEVISDYSSPDENLKNKYAASDDHKTQFILICNMCRNVPLYPNQIKGFYQTKDKLNFSCDNCSHKVNIELNSIEDLKENFPEHKNVKFVTSKKDFSPTVVLTDNPATLPELFEVDTVDMSKIKIGETNDIRREKEQLIEDKIESIKEKTASNDYKENIDDTTENLSRADRITELDMVLKELNNTSDKASKVFN